MSTKKVNKYNVKAIRKELDACIRSHSWKRFRTVLKSCCPSFCFDEIGGPRNDHDDAYVKSDERDEVDTCLLQAVVMDRAKSVRETPSSQPTLLHALIDKINSGAYALAIADMAEGRPISTLLRMISLMWSPDMSPRRFLFRKVGTVGRLFSWPLLEMPAHP